MKKLLVFGTILAAAGYVFMHYFVGGGAQVSRDSSVANQVLQAGEK